MSERRQVWIPRPEPGGSATAARVAASGFEPLVAPLLTFRVLDKSINLNGVGAIAFTSGNGVRIFAARSDRRDIPVFAVGDATAEWATEAGFAKVASANGDVTALARLIASIRPPGLVLHPGPVRRAGDLTAALENEGIAARALDLYEAIAADALPPPVVAALTGCEVGAIMIHSPRLAAVAAPLIAPFDLSGVRLVGLSKACVGPLEGLAFAEVRLAAASREDAMLAALGNPPAPR